MADSPPGDDAILVRRMLRGDSAAFDQFFADHFPRLFRFALNRTGDAAEAEEIVQATMILGIRKLHTWRGNSTLFTWLCAICSRRLSSSG